MSAKLILRISTFLVLFFAAGHSIGHFTRKSHTEVEAVAVFKAMEGYKFPIGGQLRTYDEFFEGMSLNLTIALIAFAILLWMLSNVASESPKICYTLLWPVLIAMLGFTYTGLKYFFLAPGLTCLIVSVLLIICLVLLKRRTS